MSGNTNECGDAGESPGQSSLFYLTSPVRPWNRIDRRKGVMVGKAVSLLHCLVPVGEIIISRMPMFNLVKREILTDYITEKEVNSCGNVNLS